MSDERRIDRMAGCSCLGKLLLGAAVSALAVYYALNLNQCFYSTDRGSVRTQVRQTTLELKIAMECYHTDYNRFPLPDSDLHSPNDASIRSRGPMLPILIGNEGVPQNVPSMNPKDIVYLSLPQVQNRKNGLWHDGSEWVLSDRWGEPYYLVLDTNGDGKIANPDSAASKAVPEISASALIYSSGPDRDPKTWKDNVCSWHTR